MKEFLPGIIGIYYDNKDRPTRLKEMSLYFYEVTQTTELPYCFECMIALVKADKFPNEKFETALPVFRVGICCPIFAH